MSACLKNVARLSALTLLVAFASGCGAENPMGPSLATTAPTTTFETSTAMAPVEETPAPGDGAETVTIIDNSGGSTTGGKTVWSERPGRRLGWGRQK